MKRIFATALAVFLCLSILSACGGNSGGSSDAGSGSSSSAGDSFAGETSGGPVELVFWHNRGGSAGETLDKIVADFNEKAGAAAGSPPDGRPPGGRNTFFESPGPRPPAPRDGPVPEKPPRGHGTKG